MHLIQETNLSCEKITVDTFSLTLDDITYDKLHSYYKKFEVNSVRIKDPQTLDLYLNDKIETAKPIDNITYTDEVPEKKNKLLLDCIKRKKIWGSNTHFTLNLDWNTELVEIIRKDYQKFLKRFTADTM